MPIVLKRKFNIVLIAGLIPFILFLGCNIEKEGKVLRLAHGLNENHSVHQAMVFMNEKLIEKSNGKFRLQIYPNQQLGTERECLELLQIGSIDIAKASAAVVENFIEDYKVLSLPYLFRDRAHVFAALDGEVGRDLLNAGIPFRLKGLGFYDSGSRSFYTKDEPILEPDNLKGLNIRTMESPTAMAAVNIMGGSATPLAFGELYTALQAGIVDGAENNPPSFYLTKHFEVCKYYVLDEHTCIPDVILMNSTSWDKLTQEEKTWLKESVEESVTYQRQLWMQSEKESLEKVIEAGVKVIIPEKEQFQKSVEPIYENLNSDTLVMNYVSRIRDVK